jgi:hypothetical protein
VVVTKNKKQQTIIIVGSSNPNNKHSQASDATQRVALKIVKSAAHYTEAAEDEIQILQCIGKLFLCV